MKSLTINLVFILTAAILLGACSDTDIDPSSTPTNPTLTKPQPPPPPSPANPAFTFNADTVIRYKGNNYNVEAIYVMDADGSHRTMIYNDFLTSGNSVSIGTASRPRWSGNGQQICFSGRVYFNTTPPLRPGRGLGSVYTLTVSLVNGVPIASNVTMILDGPANGVSWGDPDWSPTANEIVVVREFPSFGYPTELQIVPSGGGTPTTVFACPSTDFHAFSPCFNSDGSKIAFHVRQFSTGDRWLKVIDRATGTVLNSISLNSSYDWRDLDWSRTSGSTVLVLRNEPIGGGQSRIYTLDFSSSSTPVQVSTDAWLPTWSPDDSKIAYVQSPSGQGLRVLTLSNNSSILISTTQATSLDWKR